MPNMSLVVGVSVILLVYPFTMAAIAGLRAGAGRKETWRLWP